MLLVFYPFAFSGICTGELGEIRDDLGRFETEHVTTLAISCDPMFSLRGWADQQGYFFPLLSDFWPHGEVARAFGVFDDSAGMARRGPSSWGRTGGSPGRSSTRRARLVTSPATTRHWVPS